MLEGAHDSTLAVELPFYRQGSQTMTFQLVGAQDALELVRAACGGKP